MRYQPAMAAEIACETICRASEKRSSLRFPLTLVAGGCSDPQGSAPAAGKAYSLDHQLAHLDPLLSEQIQKVKLRVLACISPNV